jgi:signal transduction histidine kinase
VKELLDLEPSQVVNLGPSRWPAGNDLQRFLTAFEKNPESVIGDTFVYQPGHLRDASVALSAHAVRGADNVATGYILVVRDVTQEALARTGSSEFVAHVSHELKSPLNTLAMYCEALKGEDGESREFQLEATNVISDEVERLAKLISNLLSVTQIEMGTMELDRQRVRFAEFVMDCVESAKRSARDLDLDIEVDLPPDLPAVQIDKDLMRIAINNLLTNAIKYTDSGGQVRITAEDSDDAVTLCVSDTGIGIPEAELARIFEKFYRSDAEAARSRSGHGLGLPLAQEIVQMHHGTLRVESTVGEGSQFYIDLWKNTGVAEQAISG